MDLAQVLVRTVARAFYDTEQVVLVDALVHHSALSASDLGHVLGDGGKQTKVVQRLLGKLREGGLVATYTRQETRQGAIKPVNREYFYIDYRRAVDATKYRLHMLHEQIKADSKPSQEKKELVCTQCKSEYTVMEVLDSVDPYGRGSGFVCKRCGDLLKMREDVYGVDPEEDDTPAQFNKQFGAFVKLLEQIDETVVPEITGEKALQDAKPIQRDEKVNPSQTYQVVNPPTSKPATVKGQTITEKIEVSIITTSEKTAEEEQAERELKEKLAAQNQLPEWHTRSTVTGEMTALGHLQDAARREREADRPLLAIEDDEPADKKANSNLDAIFAQYEEEKKRNELLEQQEEEEEEEEDDEFEDVVALAPDELPDAKRVKLEDSAAPTPTPLPSASAVGGDDSDEDEFEDVY